MPRDHGPEPPDMEPHPSEASEADFIGACLAHPDAVAPIVSTVEPHDFAVPGLGMAWMHIRDIVSEGGYPTPTIVAERIGACDEFTYAEGALTYLLGVFEANRPAPRESVPSLAEHIHRGGAGRLAKACFEAMEGADQATRADLMRQAREAMDRASHPNPTGQVQATPFQYRDPSRIPRREWLYARHLIRKYASVTVAPGGVGKSSLTIAEALAMASGRDLLGHRVRSPLRVWLYSLEDPIDEIERRVHGVMLHHGIGHADIGNRLYLDSGRDTPLCLAEVTRDGFTMLKPTVDRVVETLIENAIDVLVIDPFVSSHRIPENDNGAIDAVAKEWARIADRANCAIDLVHHARKTGGDEVTAEHARGGVALVAAARNVRVLNRMSKEEGEKADVENHRLYFRTYNDKANLAPPAETSEWYHLASVELPNGGEHEPPDHVQAVECWQWPNPFYDVASGDLRRVQQAIDGDGYRKDVQSKDWVGKAIAETLDWDVRDAAVKARIKGMVKTWVENGALVETEVVDDKRRRRIGIEVGEWAPA